MDGNTLSDPYGYVLGDGQERVDIVDAPFHMGMYVWH